MQIFLRQNMWNLAKYAAAYMLHIFRMFSAYAISSDRESYL